MVHLKSFFSKYVLVFILLIFVAFANNSQWGKDNWRDLIEADGKGYYAYLPAAFSFHDPNFGFFDSINKKYPSPFYDYRVRRDGKVADKYFAGTAVAMLPFYFVGQLAAVATGAATDGYDKPYMLAIGVAGIFYWILGLFFVRKLLRTYAFSETTIAWVLVLLSFATNGMYYAVCEPAMSHVYSFAIVSAFVFVARKMLLENRFALLPLLAALLGFICLIRPVNGLVVFVLPFLCGSKVVFINFLREWRYQWRSLLLSVFIFCVVISFQLLIYKLQTGKFWIDAYDGEQFHFLHPHPLAFLFGYRKGFFLYTPLALIASFGLWFLFRKNKFQGIAMSGLLLLLLYVLSSWWNWWYGGSFSSRVCVEFYALLGLLLAVVLQEVRKKIVRRGIQLLLVFSLLLCQFQMYQYRYYVIHWEKMDREHYWRVFLNVNSILYENPNADLLN